MDPKRMNTTTIGIISLLAISILALLALNKSDGSLLRSAPIEQLNSEIIRLRHPVETDTEEEETSDETQLPSENPLLDELKEIKFSVPDSDVKNLVEAIAEAAAKNPFGDFGLFQMLDKGFIDMTKHWICDVRRFDDVLPLTVFVTTDEIARDALREFDPSLTIVYIPFQRTEDTNELTFGQVRYYELMNFRTELVLRTLLSGNGIMLVESDAYWSRNVLKDIKDLNLGTDFDMVSASDKLKAKRLQGGFQINLPSDNSKLLWGKLHKKMTNAIARLESIHGKDSTDYVRNEGSEQVMMGGLITHLGKKVGYKHIYLPPNIVASGKWYTKASRPRVTGIDDPAVVLNNWLQGNSNKIKRAIKWKHYFLNNETGQCIT